MLEEALESLVHRCTAADAGADLSLARDAFHARTGPIEPGDPDYESRIRAFFDWYLCEWVAPDGSRPCERLLAAGGLSAAEADVAAACTRALRGLYEVRSVQDDALVLADCLGGGRFRVSVAASTTGTDRLREGDLFDGRLLVVQRALRLAPGIVFHPAEAHEPLSSWLPRVFGASGARRVEILDGLLRMRMRLDRFTNMRAKHIYRLEALDDRNILSAAWARR